MSANVCVFIYELHSKFSNILISRKQRKILTELMIKVVFDFDTTLVTCQYRTFLQFTYTFNSIYNKYIQIHNATCK